MNFSRELTATSHDFGHCGVLTANITRLSTTSAKMYSYLKVREVNTMFGIVPLAQEEVPKAELASLHLQVGNNGDDCLPAALVSGKLSMCDTQGRNDFLLSDTE